MEKPPLGAFKPEKRPDYTGRIWEVPAGWISWSRYEVLSVNTDQRIVIFLTQTGNRYAVTFDELWRDMGAAITNDSIAPDKLRQLRLALAHAVQDHPSQLTLAFSTGRVELSPLVTLIQLAQHR